MTLFLFELLLFGQFLSKKEELLQKEMNEKKKRFQQNRNFNVRGDLSINANSQGNPNMIVYNDNRRVPLPGSNYSLPNNSNQNQNYRNVYVIPGSVPVPDSFTSLDQRFPNGDNRNYQSFSNIQQFIRNPSNLNNEYYVNQKLGYGQVLGSQKQLELKLVSNKKLSQISGLGLGFIVKGSNKKLPRTQKKPSKLIQSQNQKNSKQMQMQMQVPNKVKGSKIQQLQPYQQYQHKNNSFDDLQLKSDNDKESIQLQLQLLQQERQVKINATQTKQAKQAKQTFFKQRHEQQQFITFKNIGISRAYLLDNNNNNTNSNNDLNFKTNNNGAQQQQQQMILPPHPQSISRYQIIPIERRYVEMYQQYHVIQFPVQKVLQRFYTIEHKTEYIPKVTQTIQEYLVPEERNFYRLQYVPVQKRIVHLPIQKKLNSYKHKRQNRLTNHHHINYSNLVLRENRHVQKLENNLPSFIDTFVSQPFLINQFQKTPTPFNQNQSKSFIPQVSFEKRLPQTTLNDISSQKTQNLNKKNQYEDRTKFIKIVDYHKQKNINIQELNNGNQENKHFSHQQENSNSNQNSVINIKQVRQVNQVRRIKHMGTNFVTIEGEQYIKREQQRKRLQRQLFTL